MIGRTIASYLLVEKIGEGGMGSVYRATDIVLEREVAIKAIRPELARDPEISERFRSEARLLARIQHPAIATIYTFLSEGPELFLVMEYVRGQSFARLLEKESRLPWRRATALIAAALEGIEPAHQLGIVHRDLKPENLMLSETGQVKIMDFGVARAIGSSRQTRTGLLVGSLHYMAPEQIRAEEVDCRTDVYSLGTVLYEMVTGRLPFAGASDYAVLRAQVEEEPAPPRQLAEEIPAWLEEVILTALAKDPAHRFGTAAAMQQALLAAGTPAPRRFEALIAGTSPPDLSSTIAALPTLVRPVPRPPSLHEAPELPPPPPLPTTLSEAPPRLRSSPPVAPTGAASAPVRSAPAARWLAIGAAVAVVAGGGWMALRFQHPAPAAVALKIAAAVPRAVSPPATQPLQRPQPPQPQPPIADPTPATPPPVADPRAASRVTPPTRDAGTRRESRTRRATPPEFVLTPAELSGASRDLDREVTSFRELYHAAATTEGSPLSDERGQALGNGLSDLERAVNDLRAQFEEGFLSRTRRRFSRAAHHESEEEQVRRCARTVVARGIDVDLQMQANRPPLEIRRAWQPIRRQLRRLAAGLGEPPASWGSEAADASADSAAAGQPGGPGRRLRPR